MSKSIERRLTLQLQGLAQAHHELKARYEELEELLLPFLLFSNVYEGRDDIGTVLLQKGNQYLTVGCFTSLVDEMKRRRNGVR